MATSARRQKVTWGSRNYTKRRATRPKSSRVRDVQRNSLIRWPISAQPMCVRSPSRVKFRVAKTTLCALIPHQRYKATSRVAESYCLGSLIRNTFMQHAYRLRTSLHKRTGYRRTVLSRESFRRPLGSARTAATRSWLNDRLISPSPKCSPSMTTR
jgi:hypothetical protein